MAADKRSGNRSRKTTGLRRGNGKNGRSPGGRDAILGAYLKTAVVVIAVVAVIAVVWLIAKPFRQRAEKARLESAVSESEALEITVDPESADGSGQAGRAKIPEGMRVRFDTPGWQHDDRGWWYASDERTFYVNGWLTLDQKEYHFDSVGYMDTGWTPIGGRGCYFDEHGVYDSSADSSHMIALTFDDGPGELTGEVLDLLEENDARATFFMLGQMVEQYGAETIPRMVKLGCQLGNHSYDHSNMTTLSVSAALQQFQDTDELIAKYSGGSPASLIRFPYGSFNADLESRIDKPSIYWNFDTQDWTNPDTYEMAQKVINNTEGGDIILMHDIHENTIQSIRTMIPGLREAGFQMVTISELAAARGFELEAGVTYYGFSDTDIAHDSVSDKGNNALPEAADSDQTGSYDGDGTSQSSGDDADVSGDDDTDDSDAEASDYDEDDGSDTYASDDTTETDDDTAYGSDQNDGSDSAEVFWED